MGSGYKTPKDLKKALNKEKEERRERRLREQKEIAAMSKADKLQLEISELESRIKLVQFDLDGQFRGNQIIQNKLNMLKEQKLTKEKELENEKCTTTTISKN